MERTYAQKVAIQRVIDNSKTARSALLTKADDIRRTRNILKTALAIFGILSSMAIITLVNNLLDAFIGQVIGTISTSLTILFYTLITTRYNAERQFMAEVAANHYYKLREKGCQLLDNKNLSFDITSIELDKLVKEYASLDFHYTKLINLNLLAKKTAKSTTFKYLNKTQFQYLPLQLLITLFLLKYLL